jgi:hypothetical protein
VVYREAPTERHQTICARRAHSQASKHIDDAYAFRVVGHRASILRQHDDLPAHGWRVITAHETNEPLTLRFE